MSDEPVFREWPKIARWNREVIITEKIDGTNACVIVTEDGRVAAQSRSKVITSETDNHGFARWVDEWTVTLASHLGPGYHFGEWYGSGIQKRAGYGLTNGVKKFALFNVARWAPVLEDDPTLYETVGLDTVPVLWEGKATKLESGVQWSMDALRSEGSFVASAKGNPDVKPEGIVIFHVAANTAFKMTLEKDDEWKGKAG